MAEQIEIDFNKKAESCKCEFDGVGLLKERALEPYKELMILLESIKGNTICPACKVIRDPIIEVIFKHTDSLQWTYCACGDRIHYETDLRGYFNAL